MFLQLKYDILNDMKVQKAYSFRLSPSDSQESLFRQHAGTCRYVFNKALALLNSRHEEQLPFLSYVSLAKELTSWRHDEETPWLAEAPAQPQQKALKNLAQGFVNFFQKRAKPPVFKKKGSGDSIQYPDKKCLKLDEATSRVFFPKIGWVSYRKSQVVHGELRSATVRLSCGNGMFPFRPNRSLQLPFTPTPEDLSGSIWVSLDLPRFRAGNRTESRRRTW